MSRISLDEMMMKVAHIVAKRGTCPRKQVGAVIAKDGRILSTGYNGAPTKLPHCTDVGCIIENGHCVRTSHAEQNAICSAAYLGVSTANATMYVTVTPCPICMKMIINAGIKRVVYDEYYDNKVPPELEEILYRNNKIIRIEQLKKKKDKNEKEE
ncbi:MAG: deoxycytidylate deaminase [Candidatus Heimdallarchaeaceae archaeon]